MQQILMAAFVLAAAGDGDEDLDIMYVRETDLTDFELKTRTRLPRNVFLHLLGLLHGDLVGEQGRNYAVPADTQLLVGLSFLASGSFQWCVAAMNGISQTTASDIIRRVVLGLKGLAFQYIKFPASQNEVIATKLAFYNYGGVRNVLGVIDCTHVQFQPLKAVEAMYVNRRGRHSINVQLVCDADLKILDVVAGWPGSVHDAFIWRDCGLRNVIMNGDGWLLGDLGYPLEPWLLTKFQRPTTPPQVRFNTAVGKCRNLIEIVNGILKNMWRCLSKSGGELLYNPERVCDIVVACCVLHNICRDMHVNLQEFNEPNAQEAVLPAMEAAEIVAHGNLQARAVLIRDELVTNDFE